MVADSASRTWVDDVVPDGSSTTKLYVASPQCPWTDLPRQALFLTEFFNASVDRAASIGDSTPDGLPRDRVDMGAGGRLLLTHGKPLVADYVVTQPEVELEGSRLAVGPAAGLDIGDECTAAGKSEPSVTVKPHPGPPSVVSLRRPTASKEARMTYSAPHNVLRHVI